MEEKLKLGISSCLLGEKVRYDGQHKLDRYLRDELGRYATYVPVCPEFECGLGVPREPMRLVDSPKGVRLVTITTGVDLTDRMRAWAKERLDALEREDLCGFIFKANSPSSGMERVKVYDRNGVPRKEGVGVFAAAFMERFPLVPVEEDGRLNDPELRENFIERIFTMQRWRELLARGRSRGALIEFHARHKLLLMAHSVVILREMGALLGRIKDVPLPEAYDAYFARLAAALALKATPPKHVNVLMHAMGYFKKLLSADEKKELLDVIDAYHRAYVPLVVPVTLLNHYVRKYGEEYLAAQWYLRPHPTDLKLRNHV
jgi:uncharacterized protein YbgA (DUF1722 family)/uncharacterized protein YbbK (DUF523 family)